ncbi:MAG: DUF2851 family protein [Chloroherpetonaceae bacterium]
MTIPEKYLRHIWKNLYLNINSLQTVDGQSLSILSVGTLNAHEGADFRNAKILLNGKELSGDVEIHRRTSDWKQHRHDGNAHYERVILHVVFEHDTALPDTPPVLELSKYLNGDLHTIIAQCVRDESAFANRTALHCAPLLETIDDALKLDWVASLAKERFLNKVQHFHSLSNQPDEQIYRGLARALGYSQNTVPMEALASLVPFERLKSLARLSFSVRRKTLESIFFSLSGLLPEEFDDSYCNELRAAFSATDFSTLPKLDASAWVFFRLRPANFPTLRIAALAEILSKNLERGFFHSARDIVEMSLPNKRKLLLLESLFLADADGYWQQHYRFGTKAKQPVKSLVGKTRAAEIVLNTLLPVLYGEYERQGDRSHQTTILELYAAYPKGLTSDLSNSVMNDLFTDAYQVKSAMVEQGLIELRKAYCESFRCLECAIGKVIFHRS